MRRDIPFVLIFLMFFSFAKANTLVVDNNPTCSTWSMMGRCMGTSTACDGSTNPYSTIKNALKSANNSDTISICKGSYDENNLQIKKKNLTIEGYSGNRDDVTVSKNGKSIFKIQAANTTFKNLTINSNKYGITDNNKANGSHIFNNLAISAKDIAIYLQNGADTLTFKNLDLNSTDTKGISVKDCSHAFISDTNINAKSIGIDIQKSGKDTIKDSNITSTGDKGISLSWNADGAHELSDLNITSKDTGIYAKRGIRTLNNITLTSSDSDGIWVGDKYPITASHINVSQADGKAFYIKSNAGTSNINTFNDINLTSTQEAFSVDESGKLTIDGMYAKSTSSDAISLAWDAQGAHEISHVTLNAQNGSGIIAKHGLGSLTDFNITTKSYGIKIPSYEDASIQRGFITTTTDDAIHIDSGDDKRLVVENVVISTGNHAIALKKSSSANINKVCVKKSVIGIRTEWDAKDVNITNSKFNDNSDTGVQITSNSSYPATVNNNCFLKTQFATRNSDAHTFNGNYWDGTPPNGFDNAPLSSCPVTSCNGSTPPPPPPTLVANYRMDECSWNGTQGEVEDNAGGDNNGTITGADINTTMANTIINNAGSFSGDAIDIDDLNVSIVNDAKTTVIFWIYWDGTDNIIPFGWNRYDLWFDSGSFGFNTSNSDIYGISSDGLANGWHQVAAIFTNGDVHANKLYIDANIQTLTKQEDNSANNDYSNVQSSARIGGWLYDNGYRFKGKIDELKIYNGEVNASDITTIYDNEKNGKNYDGSDRGANQCQASQLPSPIFNYQMDECSWNGTKDEVKDSSNNHDHNGTIEGTPNTENNTTAGGMLCKTALFDNANSDSQATSTPDSDDLSPHVGSDGEMTLSAWIKTDSYPKDEQQSRVPIVAKGKSSNWEYALYLNHDKAVGFSVWQKNGSSYGEPTGGELTLNEWHQLVGVVKKGSYVRIYLDGTKVSEQTSLKGDTSNGTSPLYIARRGSGNHYFHGYIDEVKIFDKALDDSQIQTLYNNEENRKNYDGSERVCEGCSQEAKKHYKFDAWDTFRDINDRNISTEVVHKEFNLTIASLNETNDDYQEFNGTVCTQIEGDTHWTKSDFRDQNTTTASYNIASAMKDTNLTIVWKKDVNETCPLSYEDNETNATDDFAIRPERFEISLPVSTLYAGEDFNISFFAKDASDKNTSDYNETRNGSFRVDANITKSSCKLGTFTMADFSFANGQKKDVNASYSDVGELNITIKEKDGSEFAKVDKDDTPDAQRFIEQNSTILSFRPYQFSIINYAFKRNNPNADWRYMADVNDSNISISFHLQAQNEQNQTTQNFDARCSAENVGVKIDLNVTHNDANASYFQCINNTQISGHDKNLTDINFTGVVKDSNFTDGNSSDITYALNVYRVYNQVKNPRTIQVIEVNTTSSSVKNIGLSPENNSSAFYYARLYTQDLSTSKTPDTIQAKILVYDDNATDKYISDLNLTEELSNWYYFTPQDDASNGNITTLNVSKTTNKKSTNDDDINASIESFIKGTFTIKVKNPNENTQTHYIHLDATPWIWYVHENFGSDYNDSVSSGCSEHPCIKYNYNKTPNNGIGVSSGSVKGVSFDLNVSKSSRGVRVLR